MMKQKKCKCQHKSGSVKSSIIVAAIGGCGGGNGTTSTTSSVNHIDEKPSLSRKCANNWWKLKLADRKAHNELMKVQLLSPFLFCKVYQTEVWINWAKKAGLLTQKRFEALDDLSDEEIHNTDLMELAITKLQEKIIEYNDIKSSNTPLTQYLEEILDDIKVVEEAEALETVQFEAAINKVYKKNWFKSVRKQLPTAKVIEENGVNVNDYAVFLVAWQVCFYMKSVYFEKPLDAYEKDSQLDSALEVIKQEGNEYFKNKEYAEAIKTYTTILCTKPYLYIIYGNRAACYLKIQEYRLALSDGRRAVALSPTWDKGQYRYAQALFQLGKYQETYNAVTKAIKICSSGNLISLQKMAKKALALGENPTLCSNPIENVPDNLKNGIVENGEETDEYANMPELICSDSDNEGLSDQSEEELVFSENKSESLPPTVTGSKEESCIAVKEPGKEKEKVKKKRRKKSKSISIVEKPMKIARGELITLMKEGSTYLLDANTECAIREYKKVCCILQSDPDVISSTEIAILYYSLGWAYQESGISHLQESLDEFTSISKRYPNMNFPLSYYGKGLVYHKQNRFSQCIVELREALRVVEMADCVLNCCWPGVDTIIEVSVPENFKLAVEHFINLCRHPPKPDAVCRYLQCNLETTSIYLNDPDFKGFHRFICTENCFVEFHPVCWRKYKNEKNEKDFWKKDCFTPDCFGGIWSFQIFNSKNEKTHEEIYSKEIEGSNQKDSGEHGREATNKKVRKKDLLKSSSTDKYYGDESLHALSSKEEKRKRRLSSMSDKDQESDDSPRMRADDSSNLKDSKGHSWSLPNIKDLSAVYFKDGFDISKYNNFVTDALTTALDIFVRFEKILAEKGSVDIVNSPTIRNFMNTLDDNSKLLIGQMGSLRALLTHCPKFSFDEKNKNAIYLSSQEELYKESKRKLMEQRDNLIPAFHDPLFNEKLETKSNETSKTSLESVPIKSRAKKKSESSDKDGPNSDTSIKNEKKSDNVSSNDKTMDTAKQTSTNGRKSNPASDVTETIIEEIDCTKSNECIPVKVPKNKKKSKNISDIIIFNDAKKGEEVEYKIINSSDPDPASPRKREKKKRHRSRNKGEETFPVVPNRPSTPPGEKSKLRTYLEDKIDAEKHNKEARYCCPLLGENCSCSEIEKFRDETAKSSNRKVRVMKVITIEPEGKESDSDTDEDNGDALANVLELIQNKNSGRKRLPSTEQICVGEVGIQCDINNVKKVENDKEKLKLINEELMKRLKELKSGNEKSTSEFQKNKEKQRLVIENQQAEIKSHKTSLEKLRKELAVSRKVHQDEVKRLRIEQEDISTLQTEDLSAKIMEIEKLKQLVDGLKMEKKDLMKVINDNAKKEVEQLGILIKRNEEVESLRTENESLLSQAEETRKQHGQEKVNQEEIVNRLTHSLSEQLDRTQKVQIAFLEVKKEIVAVKYQQQAAIVQNTINQMQYWPSVPEIQNIRSVWDDFKKHFQNCYEKMQDEFKDIIQKVKDGQPLEDLPPAKYAEPPPFPKTPMPNNVPIPAPYYGQQMPQRMPNSLPGLKNLIPSPVQSAPPGIPVPQQRPVIDSSDSPSDSDSTCSSHTQLKPSPSSLKASSEESVIETVENNNLGTNSKKDNASSKAKIGSGVPSTVSTKSTSMTAAVGSSASGPIAINDGNKRSSIVNDTKTLDFASTVKGLGSDHFSSSPPTTSLKAVAAAADPSSAFITESEDSDIVIGKNGEPKNNKMFDRIIMRLGSIFPSFTREELRFYTCEYRRMQPQGSLSGMKFDDLILNLEKMIRAMKAAAKQPSSNNPKGSPQRANSDMNLKKKGSKSVVSESEQIASIKTKRTRANHSPANTAFSQESSWSEAVSRSTKTDIFGQEEPCVICYEEMSHQNISKLHCGHIFHRSCITCWLNEQRTCPICRVHALLPEEYPTLA